MSVIEETLHLYEILEPETTALHTTRRTKTVQEAPEPSSNKAKPSTADFNKLIITLNNAFNSAEAEFLK